VSIELGDLRRLEPVSRHWGFDRGRPVDRYYIERFLTAKADYIRGRVLEIGEPLYTRMFGADRVTKSEILDVSGGADATYTCTLEDGGQLPSDAFDCVVCTQTFQFVYDVRSALATVHRILKHGGSLLATVPGITRTSRQEYGDSWFWSFTSTSVRRLLEEPFPAAGVDIEVFGNVLAASAFLYGLAASELEPSELDHQDPDFAVIVAAHAVK
jgi:SAM-dependent methyltransferase